MTPNIFPALRYRDGHQAIDWLVRVFGFEAQAVFDAPDGGVGHAQLRFGAGVIGLNSASSTPAGSPWATVTQGIYVCVADVDAHHDRAAAAGATIVTPLTDQSYGSRDYAARDPEGHLWGFGTYDMQAPEGEPNIFVGLHYQDGRPRSAFLERAFGFARRSRCRGRMAASLHAEMRLGDGAILIDSGPTRSCDVGRERGGHPRLSRRPRRASRARGGSRGTRHDGALRHTMGARLLRARPRRFPVGLQHLQTGGVACCLPLSAQERMVRQAHAADLARLAVSDVVDATTTVGLWRASRL